MSEQKTVFNKLFKKENLASQKVELALVDDINSALQKVKDLGIGGGADKLFLNKKSEAESLLKRTESRINGLNSFRK